MEGIRRWTGLATKLHYSLFNYLIFRFLILSLYVYHNMDFDDSAKWLRWFSLKMLNDTPRAHFSKNSLCNSLGKFCQQSRKDLSTGWTWSIVPLVNPPSASLLTLSFSMYVTIYLIALTASLDGIWSASMLSTNVSYKEFIVYLLRYCFLTRTWASIKCEASHKMTVWPDQKSTSLQILYKYIERYLLQRRFVSSRPMQ